jgi:hypothetical protein
MARIRDQPVLLAGGVERTEQRFGRAGFGQKTKDVSLVDRRDRRLHVGLPGEQ